MSATSRCQRRRLDLATTHLVNEVLDEHWSAGAAAFRLRILVGDDLALIHQLCTRLRRAAERRPTELTKRALLTLNVVLAPMRQGDAVTPVG